MEIFVIVTIDNCLHVAIRTSLLDVQKFMSNFLDYGAGDYKIQRYNAKGVYLGDIACGPELSINIMPNNAEDDYNDCREYLKQS